VRQKKTGALKLAKYGIWRLTGGRNSNCFQQSTRFALKFSGIKEVGVGERRKSAKEKRGHVNGPVSASPFQALYPPRNMFGGCGLSAAVAS